ncbi:MAG: VOC family protein [Acidimicrobiales bacterium]
MRPVGIHHVALNVTDLDAALQFYEEGLGFTRRDDRPDFSFGGAWLDAGSGQLHLLVAEPAASVGQHFAVLVEDLGETVDELRAKGLRPSDPTPVGQSLQAFVSDPSGNLVELHQHG